MKFNSNLIKYLLLIAILGSISSAKESCKGGACRVSLDSLDNSKISKKKKSLSTNSETTKNKELNEKDIIKLSVK